MASNLLEIDDQQYYKQMFKDYGKSENDLKEYMDILRKWAATQPHFPEEPTDRTLRFLVTYNKFSIERAKQKLDMYYTIRSLIPELYTKNPLSPEMIQEYKITHCIPLPKTTPNFERVIFMQFNPEFGPEHFNYEKFAASFVNVLELLVESDDCYNFHWVFDCNGLQLGHLAKMNPMIIRKATLIVEKVYSNRVKSICLVHYPQFMETFFNNVIKPLLHPKIRNRIKLFSGSTGTENFLKDFGREIMPKDIGGDERSLAELSELLVKEYEKRRERFDKLETLKVDESKRPSKLVNDDVLGYYGNFKQINVD